MSEKDLHCLMEVLEVLYGGFKGNLAFFVGNWVLFAGRASAVPVTLAVHRFSVLEGLGFRV